MMKKSDLYNQLLLIRQQLELLKDNYMEDMDALGEELEMIMDEIDKI